ncbi:branched-chain amino acid ABC transporter substrate-binding protein [Desulfuromonas versatilis]|uniref:Branched-chain amino acid ABC transporter substrate-binding protein n=1 Tax=Desulfuromonas versatilis TaxID=2802975 RepID=A0ABM8HSK0_9BACT|nr:ABC transporter substrate-binding protein [Desulfuromonas versatilis]BCR04931.1 branched-chain amino acid ABC transporter substrate-binding protein [Desulfuromonas versatilis]
MRKRLLGAAVALAFLGTAGLAAAADKIPVGHLAALTGPTSDVGVPYGQGIADALNYINKNGGVNGKQIEFETVDYAYNAPRAVATYKKWMASMKPVAIQGWGTADTEALVQFIAQDQVPYISASYSGHLTDPTGKSPKTKAPAPYNYFYGPSYSDACRGLVQWAMEDWKAKGKEGKPKFVHMGDNHPYPNAPKEACAAYAEELGFEVLNPIVYSLKPADAKAQCLSLKESGANYAYLGNTSGSNISLLNSCTTVGVQTQYLSNIWGWDENSINAAKEAGNGVAWVVGAPPWGSAVPGMKTLAAISRMSDSSGKSERPLHYIRGVCATFFMKDAMEMADKAGGITGPNIKKAMDQMKDHVPAGLEGVCTPSTWTAEDHRGTTEVSVYTSDYKDGKFTMTKMATEDVPRRAEWLGW